MIHRRVEYLPSGVKHFAEPVDLVATWKSFTSTIPAQYALGTAQHETGFALNERDTEVSNFISMGIFQLSEEEIHGVSIVLTTKIDPYTLGGSCQALAYLAEQRLKAIVAEVGAAVAMSTPDVWAYLALAHNQGLGATLKTLKLHGLDWQAYKARNPSLHAMGQYGDDCISGGERWPEVARLFAPFA